MSRTHKHQAVEGFLFSAVCRKGLGNANFCVHLLPIPLLHPMTRNVHLCLIFCLLVLSNALSAQTFYGSRARQIVPQADMVWQKEGQPFPAYIRFSTESRIAIGQFASLLKYNLSLDPNLDFVLEKQETDRLGMQHYSYSASYKGYKIAHIRWMLHTQDGKIVSMNGNLSDNFQLNPVVVLSEQQAHERAVAAVGATKLMPEGDEHHPLQATELLIAPLNGNYAQPVWRLCYKFDVFVLEPRMSRDYVYVDAATGEIVWTATQLHSADVPATGTTIYSGTVNFTCDNFSGGYRLREAARSGVITLNMQQGTDYQNAVDFVNATPNWTATANLDAAARDAHWGAEKTYDYFFGRFGRDSYDNAGSPMISYIHYDVGMSNAFWDGQSMTYGDGAAQPFTTLDICGHEFAHGVTGNSASLIYQNESGALNESFSDIFGTAIEFFARPNNADWIMSSEFGLNYIRSLSNPKAKGDPDTYKAGLWYTGTFDNGGVHINSGVQNKWFYLLSVGGSGVNDLGNAYTVQGIGIESAEEIAYRNLTVYLTPTSEYYDARFYSIMSAIDLFGSCSPEVEATTQAWYAVGVGTPYQPSVTASFVAPVSLLCTPGSVTFYNFSSNANNFLWNFGDGSGWQPDNSPIVTHTYANNGAYNVQLIAEGGSCGTDTLSQPNFVQVDPNLPCTVTMQSNTNQSYYSCQGAVTDEGGENQNYLPGGNSYLTIAPTNAYEINLDFGPFRIAFNDTFFIYKGMTTGGQLLGAYTINSLHSQQLSYATNAVTIHFKTDNTVEDSGFVFNWACTPITAVPKADFYADNLNSCDGRVQFTDISTQGGGGWKWDFGDGTTATNVQNPLHEYTQNGTFNVKLKVSNYLGTDSTIKNQYVTVSRPSEPLASDVFKCGGAASLYAAPANGTGEINWFSAVGVWMGSGNTLTLNNPANNSQWTAKSYEFGPFTNGGRLDNSGPGGFTNVPNVFMKFDILEDCMLHAVDMYANGDGYREVYYADKYGNVQASRYLWLKNGYNKVILNFPLKPMTDARIGVSGTNVNLFRNLGGSTYPYNIANYVTIKGASNLNLQQYFYFYNWEIADMPCVSLPKIVKVLPNGQNPVAQFGYNTNLSTVNFDASSSTNTAVCEWDFGDGATGLGQQVQHIYNALGTYAVKLRTISGNCKDSTTQNVAITALGLAEPGLSQSVQLFPNPGNGRLFLQWQAFSDKKFNLSVCNQLGQRLVTGKWETQANQRLELDLSRLSKGIYRIYLQTDTEIFSFNYILE